MGHAALYVALTSVVVDLAPPEQRASEVSRLSLFLYGGLGIGPPLAEWLLPRLGFDATWLTAAGLLLAALLAALVVAETGSPAAVDHAPHPRPRTGGPLIPDGVLVPGLMVLFPAVGYAAVVGFATLYAESLGMGDAAGLLYAVFAATVLAVRLVAGRLADRFGNLAVATPGLGMSVAGLLALAFVPTPSGATAGVVLFGAGFALIFPALLTIS
ncbi:MAG: MFS transporter [Actinobacteria bacterium]|nr:MFS transporter [Actinomycetota bacterium]